MQVRLIDPAANLAKILPWTVLKKKSTFSEVLGFLCQFARKKEKSAPDTVI